MADVLLLTPTYEGARLLGPWLTQRLEEPDAINFAERRGEIELAVHEIVTNVIDHALANTASEVAPIEVQASVHNGRLAVTTSDTGAAFDEASYAAPTDGAPQVHGYGLMIVEQLAESCEYSRCERRGSNTWTAVFTADRPKNPNSLK